METNGKGKPVNVCYICGNEEVLKEFNNITLVSPENSPISLNKTFICNNCLKVGEWMVFENG